MQFDDNLASVALLPKIFTRRHRLRQGYDKFISYLTTSLETNQQTSVLQSMDDDDEQHYGTSKGYAKMIHWASNANGMPFLEWSMLVPLVAREQGTEDPSG